MLNSMYPIEMIENTIVISLNDKNFILSKIDSKNLTKSHFNTLLEVAKNRYIHNPVFVEIDYKGNLIIE